MEAGERRYGGKRISITEEMMLLKGVNVNRRGVPTGCKSHMVSVIEQARKILASPNPQIVNSLTILGKVWNGLFEPSSGMTTHDASSHSCCELALRQSGRWCCRTSTSGSSMPLRCTNSVHSESVQATLLLLVAHTREFSFCSTSKI